jgi:ABC-type uncharacterized transport system fused permease/ATPase subunit
MSTVLDAPPSGAARLAASLALLLPRDKRRRVVAAAALAAIAAYAAAQHAERQRRAARARKARKARPGGADAGALAAPARPPRAGARPGGAALRRLLPLLLRVAGPRLLALAALALARTALSNRLARLQGHLFRAAFLRRAPLFARNLAENVALAAAAAGLEATARAAVARLELRWRAALVDRLHDPYFRELVYYRLSHVDRRGVDPEQTLCEDAPRLAAGLAELARDLANAAVDGAFYAYALRRYSGTHKYTAGVVAYIVGAGAATALAAPPLGGLHKKQAALEGGYRAAHARLRANAESVALYRGGGREADLLRGRYRQVAAHAARLLGVQWRFAMVQDFFLKYLGATAAVALIIGPFFGGRMRPEATVAGRARMLSDMRYHTSVVIALFGSLGTLATASRRLMRLGAHAERVEEMGAAMRAAARGGAGAARDGAAGGRLVAAEDAIEFDRVTVVTPGDATLVRDLSLKVPAGTNLLVTGPNGAGKSSLFRCLGGLWPLAAGRIARPGGADAGLSSEIFYVPQRPYVSVGSLQDQLLYPLEATPAAALPEAELRALLRQVDLEHLLDRPGGASAALDWGEALSLGEQQRLGMARLLFHRPRFAILDECTSGVTVDMERRFCELVRSIGCTCVTISHRPALMAFHDVVLALDGEGGWSTHAGRRARGARAGGEGASGVGEAGGKGASAAARGGDAATVLAGMTAGGGEAAADAEEAARAGRVLARSPPPPAGASAVALPPPAAAAAALPPRASAARWRAVAAVLAGGDPRKTAASVGAVAGVVVLRTLLQDRIASLNGRSVDLVLRQDLRGFLRLVGVSVAQSAASAALAPSLRHVADLLALRWRGALTDALAAPYLSGSVFYTVAALGGVRDADQRLTRDAERLADDLAALVPTLVKPVVDVAWFSWRLWRLTGARGGAILYAYAALGYGALRAVTPDFGALAARQYALEGGFRAAHARLRQHAESVAFFGGGAREGGAIRAAYAALSRHLDAVVGARWRYAAADEFFAKQLPHSVTWLLTLLYALERGSGGADFGSTATQVRP